jgi:hypothetical protein
MIARRILALPNVMQQAAPGNVCTRGLPERCSIVPIKHTGATGRGGIGRRFAGAACQRTLSPANPILSNACARDLEQSKAAPLQALGKLTPRGPYVLSAETAVTYFRAFFAASITLCSTSAGSSW